MIEQKPWYRSRTILIGIAQIIGGIGLLVGFDIDLTSFVDLIAPATMAASGAAVVGTRSIAKARVFWGQGGPISNGIFPEVDSRDGERD